MSVGSTFYHHHEGTGGGPPPSGILRDPVIFSVGHPSGETSTIDDYDWFPSLPNYSAPLGGVPLTGSTRIRHVIQSNTIGQGVHFISVDAKASTNQPLTLTLQVLASTVYQFNVPAGADGVFYIPPIYNLGIGHPVELFLDSFGSNDAVIRSILTQIEPLAVPIAHMGTAPRRRVRGRLVVRPFTGLPMAIHRAPGHYAMGSSRTIATYGLTMAALST